MIIGEISTILTLGESCIVRAEPAIDPSLFSLQISDPMRLEEHIAAFLRYSHFTTRSGEQGSYGIPGEFCIAQDDPGAYPN